MMLLSLLFVAVGLVQTPVGAATGTAGHGARHQSRRHARRVPRQMPARSFRGGQLFVRDGKTYLPNRCSEVRHRDLPRRLALSETVHWSAKRGAQVVFHPHHQAKPGACVPATFADPANSFHEKAVLCRAAENTCYFATVNVNVASPGSPTTSAVVCPDGTLLCYQPYGKEGLLTADLGPSAATGLLASRLRFGNDALHGWQPAPGPRNRTRRASQ